MMYTTKDTKVIAEEELEVKIIPVGEVMLAQISSQFIRGTLMIVNDIEKEELTELGSLLFDLIQNALLGATVDPSTEIGN